MRARKSILGSVAVLAAMATGALPLAASPPAVAASGGPAAATATARDASASVAPARATAHAQTAVRRGTEALPPGVRPVCPVPDRPGIMTCLALIRGGGRARARPDLINPSAYRPVDLQEAYDLVTASKNGGRGMTVALVDGGSDPDAASNLATYRKEWGQPACDAATGAGCVVQVNQDGAARPLAMADPEGNWEVEESLDLDMVSAICPNCRILLVGANLVSDGFSGYDPTTGDFMAAEESAVRLGAKFVSNSWGGMEFPGVQSLDRYFDHPGVAITVAAGDNGYGPSYPSTSPFVTSVGGTSLAPAPGTARGWTETVWDGTGSGCSAFEPKPAWQTADGTSPDGCLNRTDNDVSAVADPNTGVWVYDTYPNGDGPPQWITIGGTSVSSPIVAATYALAGVPKPGTYPASYLYQKSSAADLYPVTSGSNGICETYRAYLCHGKAGYDAPSGLGTPDGTAAFTAPAGNTVSVADPGPQDVGAGVKVRLAVHAVGSAGRNLTYTARNLPRGLSISTAGVIAGTAPRTASTTTVTVTAAGPGGETGSVSFRFVVVPDLAAQYRRVTGQVVGSASTADRCLNDVGGAKNSAKVEFADCAPSAAQQWALVPETAPDGLETLRTHGKCLQTTGDAVGGQVRLWSCDHSAAEAWSLEQGSGSLWDPASGRCLSDPNADGSKAAAAVMLDCGDNAATVDQQLRFPVGQMLSAVAGLCAADPGNSAASGTAVRLEPCDGGPDQNWDDFSAYEDTPSGTPKSHHGLCLSAFFPANPNTGFSYLENAPVAVAGCGLAASASDYVNGVWVLLTNGEIFNTAANLCLTDPGASAVKGARLRMEDCDGDAGQIWAVG
jgi:hypothetical protein